MIEILLMCYTNPLGILKILPDRYLYTSNIDIERTMWEEGHIHPLNYTLRDSYERESKELFSEFKKVLKNFTRDDICKRAGFLPNDSINQKLFKLAKLKTHPYEIYICTPERASEFTGKSRK